MLTKKSISYEQALHKAAAYCSLSERCVDDVQHKLVDWGAEFKHQGEIISYLIEEKFIDEERFAIAYVKDKFLYNKWGKIKIRIMLQQKKISKDLINKALNEIDEKSYEDMILRLIEDKTKSLKYKDDYDKKVKLMRYLSGKGFELDTVLSYL